MSVLDLRCLALHATINAPSHADDDLDLDVLHEVSAAGLDGETVMLTLRLLHGDRCLGELHATYLVTFEDEPRSQQRAWRAVERCWPYLRQAAGTHLAGAGLQVPLPVDFPGDAPTPDIPAPAPTSNPAPVLPDDLARTVPLPPALDVSLALHRALRDILDGGRQWTLSAVRLYGALVMAGTHRPPGVSTEVASRNDTLLDDLLQREAGVSLATWRALPAKERRDLLIPLRQAVMVLSHDVIIRQADASSGQLQDSYSDEVEELLEPAEALPSRPGIPTTGASPRATYFEYVTQPFSALGVDPDAPDGQAPMSMIGSTMVTRDGRVDVIASALVLPDFGDPFDDSQALEDMAGLATLYRIRHLHVDRGADPPLAFLTDLTLDQEIAEWESNLEPPFTEEQLRRWYRIGDLDDACWPPDDHSIELARLGWATDSGSVEALEAFIAATPELNDIQLEEASRVPTLNLAVVVAHPAVTSELLVWLSHHPDRAVRQAVAAHPLTPDDVLNAFWDDYDVVRSGLATNPRTPPELLKRLAHVESFDVRAQVACHPQLGDVLLRVLAEDPFWGVRRNVAGNSATPERLLEILSHDDHDDVRAVAELAIARRQPERAPAASNHGKSKSATPHDE